MTTNTPSACCQQLADFLAEVAHQELTPTLYGLLPDARKAALRAYWTERLAELGIGKALQRAWKETTT